MEIRNSINLKLLTPDGDAYIIIEEDAPGKIHSIKYIVGKSGTSVRAWAESLAEMTSYILRNGTSLNDVIIMLSNITTQSSSRHLSGINCRSGPEAIFIALMRYRSTLARIKPTPTYYRSATIGRK